MNKETYEGHKQTLADGKIVIVGGRTAISLEELDILRQIELRKAGKDTARSEAEQETLEAEQEAGKEALATAGKGSKSGKAADKAADKPARATAAKMKSGAEDNLPPKAVHDNKTAEDLIRESEIDPQAGSETAKEPVGKKEPAANP